MGPTHRVVSARLVRGVILALSAATLATAVAALSSAQVLMHLMFTLTDLTHLHGSLTAAAVVAQASAVLLASVLLVHAPRVVLFGHASARRGPPVCS
ncbi:hypothetical protein JOF56_008761 [Kibdelosporangium banguiense]|uniref:Uncharacterized protein n=1 Tax=Kibdelosporangium banguiense TaxID=1365924 RepID=A0ABS4TWT2_9PSEU|nr:hypothetical protein [Kibdelosporangium banguiense]MBP2328376.1 hypothetical protein [Kibdelosporangium banguiense]